MKKVYFGLLLMAGFSVFASEGSGGGGADKYGNTNTGAKSEDYDDGATSLSESRASETMVDESTDSISVRIGGVANKFVAKDKVFNDLELLKMMTGFLFGRDSIRLGMASKKFKEAGFYGSRFLRAARIAQSIVLNSNAGIALCLTTVSNGRIAVGYSDGTIRVWNLNTGHVVTLLGHANRIKVVTVLPDGRLVSGSYDGTIRIWDLDKKSLVVTLSGHVGAVNCIAILPNGRIVSGDDRNVRVWNLAIPAGKDGHMVLLRGHSGPVHFVEALSDLKIVSGSADGTVRVWSIDTGLAVKFAGHTDGVMGLMVLQNGNIVAGANNGTIRVWNVDTGEAVKLVGHVDATTSFANLSDSQIVSGSFDGTVRVWDVVTKQAEILKGHTNVVTRIAILSDKRIVSGACDNTIRVWNVKLPAGHPDRVVTLLGHTSEVVFVHILWDDRIVSGSADGTIRVWPNEPYLMEKITKTQKREDYVVDGPGVFEILFSCAVPAHEVAAVKAVKKSKKLPFSGIFNKKKPASKSSTAKNFAANVSSLSEKKNSTSDVGSGGGGGSK